MKRDPYPLSWPEGWPRTVAGRRDRPKFKAMFARDRGSVIRQLEMRRASHIVITSDLPTRNDGLPYANASCNDPGIAVWWVEKGKERVMACDRWNHIVFNLRAIDMSLNALRGLDRWGASEMVDRAFAGFAALPPGDGLNGAYAHGDVPEGYSPPRRSWRRLFDIATNLHDVLGKAEILAIVKTRYRMQIRDAHPDAGGSHDLAAELNAALADAEKELGGS